MILQDKKEIVGFFLNNGFLISPDLLSNIENFDLDYIEDKIKNKKFGKDRPLVINNELFSLINNGGLFLDINWYEFEKAKSNLEKGRTDRSYNIFLDILNYSKSDKGSINVLLQEIKEDKKEMIFEEEKEKQYNVIILKSYFDKQKEREASDFSLYYNNRYNSIKKILLNRPELSLSTSINRIFYKNSREEATIIGMVYDKKLSKNNNILLTLEDPTGKISVLVTKNKTDLYNQIKDVTLDETIGVIGVVGEKIIFANKFFFPDIQSNNTVKYSEDEVYCAFISDIHVGSRLFLREEFEKFIEWINGNIGSQQQRQQALRIKYLFVVGDTVDGVGVYPNQENELLIKDIKLQYQELYNLLDRIRKDVNIIICCGQHDASRLSEPQPPINKIYAEPVYNLKNAFFVSNPSLVNIHSSRNFEGFNILMYHGASFHYYIDNIESLRTSNSRDNPHHVLKYLLIKRHVAPSHGSTLFVPDVDYDPLVIERVPDVFVCGDMHRSDVSKYKDTILINCSCWQAKTAFQEKTGNNPDPGKVPVLNLKTREVKVIKFIE